RLDHRQILGVERKAEDAGIVGDVLGDAEPRADDDAGDRRAVEDVADADIGDAHPVPIGDLLQHDEQFLEQGPAPQVSIIFLYLRSEAVSSSARCGSGRPRYFSESSPPRRVPYASKVRAWSPHKA